MDAPKVRLVRTAATALLAAAAAALAASPLAMAKPAGSAPANLCKLNVKQQLKALPVGTTCTPSKTAHVGTLTIEGANWGTTDHSIALQVYLNVPQSRFMQQIDKSGKKVAVGAGNVGWEQAGPTGVALYAWVKGLGMIVMLHRPIGTNSDRYLTPVLTFTKTLATQI